MVEPAVERAVECELREYCQEVRPKRLVLLERETFRCRSGKADTSFDRGQSGGSVAAPLPVSGLQSPEKSGKVDTQTTENIKISNLEKLLISKVEGSIPSGLTLESGN
jgi:hypothetical protein